MGASLGVMNMRAFRLFKKLTLYYALMGVFLFLLLYLFPNAKSLLPIGGAESLLMAQSDDPFAAIEVGGENVSSLSGSLIWMISATGLALALSIPTAWTYIASRRRNEYDNSIVRTIVILPILLTCIVLMVHNSLALAFSLAGIVGAVRFRNTLKSPGDALYVLMAIGIGLAAGIGAAEIAIVMSIIVNYCYVGLWISEFGVEKGSQRYLRHPHDKPATDETPVSKAQAVK